MDGGSCIFHFGGGVSASAVFGSESYMGKFFDLGGETVDRETVDLGGETMDLGCEIVDGFSTHQLSSVADTNFGLGTGPLTSSSGSLDVSVCSQRDAMMERMMLGAGTTTKSMPVTHRPHQIFFFLNLAWRLGPPGDHK